MPSTCETFRLALLPSGSCSRRVRQTGQRSVDVRPARAAGSCRCIRLSSSVRPAGRRRETASRYRAPRCPIASSSTRLMADTSRWARPACARSVARIATGGAALAGQVQRLARVDVAEPGSDPLIQQAALSVVFFPWHARAASRAIEGVGQRFRSGSLRWDDAPPRHQFHDANRRGSLKTTARPDM